MTYSPSSARPDLPPPRGSGWPWEQDQAAPAARADRRWPRITIITPSYNQAAYLEETIRSVLLQGYPNLEYIVIDGGSSDGSVEILKRYSPWIDYWVSEPDRGQSDAINKGLARATGEWFNWINSDDFLYPGALHALVEAAASATPIVAGLTRNLHPEGPAAQPYGTSWRGAPPGALLHLGVNQPGSLLRTNAVRAAGSVRTDLHYTMDLDLWLRLLLAAPAGTLPDRIPVPVAVYRYHATSKTCAGHDVFAAEELAIVLDLYASLASRPLPPALNAVRAMVGAPPRGFDASASRPATDLLPDLLDRLIVTDNLLFRGLWRQSGDAHAALDHLQGALRALRPELDRVFGPRVRSVCADALLHALESTGRFEPAVAWSAFSLAPSPRLLRGLARLGWRRRNSA